LNDLKKLPILKKSQVVAEVDQFYSFEAMIVTLGIGGMMSLESNCELIRRTVASVIDHDSFAGIPI
jgi:hypothetical protein